MNLDPGNCYKICNNKFAATNLSQRLFCKKACDADEDSLYVYLNFLVMSAKKSFVLDFA